MDGTGEQLRVVFTVPVKCYTFDWGQAAVALTLGMCSLAEQPKHWSHRMGETRDAPTCSANGRPSGTSAATRRPVERLPMRVRSGGAAASNARLPADMNCVDLIGAATRGRLIANSIRNAIGCDVGL
jgi:hypothetical protein